MTPSPVSWTLLVKPRPKHGLTSHLYPPLKPPARRSAVIFPGPSLLSFLLLFDPLTFPPQPLTQWHCTSINRSWQWHVEFFITSPQGEPSCLCLCIFLSHPCLSLSVCLSHALIPSALWVGRGGELCFCCLLFGQMRGAAAVAVSDWSPLHGLSSPRLWLLHCGYHPTQDRPPQPGCASLLPMGEEGTLWFCVCLGGLSVHVMDF